MFGVEDIALAYHSKVLLFLESNVSHRELFAEVLAVFLCFQVGFSPMESKAQYIPTARL